MKFEVMEIKEIHNLLKNKTISFKELLNYFINNIYENKNLNALIEDYTQESLEIAEKLDYELNKGSLVWKELTGIPIILKDNIALKNKRMTCGSKMLENFISPYNATVTEKLLQSGAIILGKSNMDEFAMGSSNETSYFGPVKNPLNHEYVPGGSSGGSAAAVAAGMCVASLGSDTGGSVRQPSAYCGTYGLKPTYGTVSRYGLTAFASSFDQIGPIANNIYNLSLIHKIISGFDKKDSTSIENYSFNINKVFEENLSGLKIGICPKIYKGICQEIEDDLYQIVSFLISNGVEILEVDLPNFDYGIPIYYILATAEASSNLARYDGVRYTFREHCDDLNEMYEITRSKGFGEEVKRRILIGTYVLSAGYYDEFYGKALKARNLIKKDFENIFSEVDALLLPTTPDFPFKFGEKSSDPLAMYLEDLYTVLANVAGIPALSFKGNKYGDFYTGLQLFGNYFSEEKLLNIAYFIEKNFGGNNGI